MLTELIELQRHINEQVSASIATMADGGSAWLLLSLMLMALAFGAVHALTPGHNKAVLATYVAGSQMQMMRALATALLLSFVHISMAVLIALFSLPLVSVALGSVGRAPELEAISRAMIGMIGLWMIWRAARGSQFHPNQSSVLGFTAGLIPCPLTLFAMTLAMARGVPVAGIAFALGMMGGVAIILSAVALTTWTIRQRFSALLLQSPQHLHLASRSLEGTAGILLVLMAVKELFR